MPLKLQFLQLSTQHNLDNYYLFFLLLDLFVLTSLTHSLTHSFTHSLTYSLTLPLPFHRSPRPRIVCTWEQTHSCSTLMITLLMPTQPNLTPLRNKKEEGFPSPPPALPDIMARWWGWHFVSCVIISLGIVIRMV